MTWGLPTLLQIELLDTRLIWGDGGTLDTNRVLLDGLCGVNGDLIVGLISVLESLSCVRLVLWRYINRRACCLTRS